MALWWELAIPAASTLGGVSATVWAQTLLGSRQRKHDIKMRTFDEKKEAFLLYPELLFQVRASLSCFVGVDVRSYRVHEIGPAVDEMARLQRDGGTSDAEAARALELSRLVVEVAKHDRKTMEQHARAVAEGLGIIRKIERDLTRSLFVLQTLATPPVLLAADRLRCTVNPELTVSDFVAARDVYLTAVRQELLV